MKNTPYKRFVMALALVASCFGFQVGADDVTKARFGSLRRDDLVVVDVKGALDTNAVHAIVSEYDRAVIRPREDDIVTGSHGYPVTSVNGKTGEVVLAVGDISGAASKDDVSSAVSALERSVSGDIDALGDLARDTADTMDENSSFFMSKINYLLLYATNNFTAASNANARAWALEKWKKDVAANFLSADDDHPNLKQSKYFTLFNRQLVSTIEAVADLGRFLKVGDVPAWAKRDSPPVSSVNGKTGEVTLAVGDISGAVSEESLTGTLSGYLKTGDVQEWAKSDSPPVSSVNGKTGEVTLSVGDISDAVSLGYLLDTLSGYLKTDDVPPWAKDPTPPLPKNYPDVRSAAFAARRITDLSVRGRPVSTSDWFVVGGVVCNYDASQGKWVGGQYKVSDFGGYYLLFTNGFPTVNFTLSDVYSATIAGVDVVGYTDTLAKASQIPVVHDWAKAESKPGYSVSEISGLSEALGEKQATISVSGLLVGDGSGGVTVASTSDITALGIPAQDTTYSEATHESAGLMSAADKEKLDGVAEGAAAVDLDLATSGAAADAKIVGDAFRNGFSEWRCVEITDGWKFVGCTWDAMGQYWTAECYKTPGYPHYYNHHSAGVVEASATWSDQNAVGLTLDHIPSAKDLSRLVLSRVFARPTKTSQLENDSGFLTQHQDISGKADKTELGYSLSVLDLVDAWSFVGLPDGMTDVHVYYNPDGGYWGCDYEYVGYPGSAHYVYGDGTETEIVFTTSDNESFTAVHGFGYKLCDRAVNAVSVSTATTLTLPELVNASKSRDFYINMAVTGSQDVTFSPPTDVTYTGLGNPAKTYAAGTYLLRLTETSSNVFNVVNCLASTGSYNDLTDKPTKISQLENDSGFTALSEAQLASISSSMPADLDEVEYVEFTGSQYVDLGFKANQGTIKIDFVITPQYLSPWPSGVNPTYHALLGSRYSTVGPTPSGRICNAFLSRGGTLRPDLVCGMVYSTEIPLPFNVTSRVILERGTVIVDGSYTNTTVTTTTGPQADQVVSFFLGSMNEEEPSGTTFAKYCGYWGPTRVYRAGVLFMDLVPVRKYVDGGYAGFFYDRASGTLFGGTPAALLAGPIKKRSVTPLSGKQYDFATNKGLYLAVRDIVEALGGSVTNFPAISQ